MRNFSLAVGLVALSFTTAPARAQQPDWKFEDEFANRRGGWPTGATPRGDEYGYANGKYRVFIKVLQGQVEAGQIAGIPLGDRRFQTLSVEADVVQRTGPAAVLEGIACATSANAAYFFLINLDGSYFITGEAPGTATVEVLQSGRTTSVVRGIGATNRLQAQCIGGAQEARLIFSVNGEQVAEARGGRGKSFDRIAFAVTTVHTLGYSAHTRHLVNKQRPWSPIDFTAEVFFDNVALAGVR